MKNSLLRFLILPAGRDNASVSAYRRPLGYLQLALTGTAARLTLPTLGRGQSIGYVVIQCEGGGATDYARWRDDGTVPTAAVGMKLFSGQELDYAGEIGDIAFIVGSGAATLNISYYQ